MPRFGGILIISTVPHRQTRNLQSSLSNGWYCSPSKPPFRTNVTLTTPYRVCKLGHHRQDWHSEGLKRDGKKQARRNDLQYMDYCGWCSSTLRFLAWVFLSLTGGLVRSSSTLLTQHEFFVFVTVYNLQLLNFVTTVNTFTSKFVVTTSAHTAMSIQW